MKSSHPLNKVKVFLIFLLFLTSCSPATRLANLLRKNPDLIKTDTVFRQDTTIIQEIRLDTMFIMSSKTDTFILIKDKLKIKIVHHHDTLMVESVQGADTIIKTITHTVNTVQPPKALNFFERNIWLPLGKFFSILLLLIIIYVVVRVGFKVKLPFLP